MRSRSQPAAVLALLTLAVVPVVAETGTGEASLGWSWPAYIILPLLLFALLYARGTLRMWRRTRLQKVHIFCFIAGWLSLIFALDSPIHDLSEQLFWVHMTQHEILMLVSAPLLILSRPAAPMLWSLPDDFRTGVAGFVHWRAVRGARLLVSAPLAAWLLQALALWLWHAPSLFVAALQHESVHALQHISFFGSALLFWWALFHNHGGRLGYGGAVLYVFTTIIHTSVLGAWLTFSPQIWYSPYLLTAPQWHWTALQDQQIGGLIMWIPAGTLLTIVALVLLRKWIAQSEKRWNYTLASDLIRGSGGGIE